MCAIIGWSGSMPVGLLSQLLAAAQTRGTDSTGVAFINNETKQYTTVKQAISAIEFTRHNSDYIKEARLSGTGIAHCRNASKGMPINNENAHPFVYDRYIFAHNGAVKNWLQLKKELIRQLETEPVIALDSASRLARLKFLKDALTDSMILGPYIEALNFESVVGSLGLVWLFQGKLYCFASKKELTSAKVVWQKENDKTKDYTLTLVASTWPIIEKALAQVKNFIYDAEEVVLTQDTLYSITPAGVQDEGIVTVNAANQTDSFTSSTIAA